MNRNESETRAEIISFKLAVVEAIYLQKAFNCELTQSLEQPQQVSQ